MTRLEILEILYAATQKADSMPVAKAFDGGVPVALSAGVTLHGIKVR